MQCPICSVELVMSERQGIEIDYCPKCRGIWLDRGEIDKIIEKSVSSSPAMKLEETRIFRMLRINTAIMTIIISTLVGTRGRNLYWKNCLINGT